MEHGCCGGFWDFNRLRCRFQHLQHQGYFETFTTSRWFWNTYNIKVILRHLRHEGYFQTFWNILSKHWISEQELCKSVYVCQRYRSFNHFTWNLILYLFTLGCVSINYCNYNQVCVDEPFFIIWSICAADWSLCWITSNPRDPNSLFNLVASRSVPSCVVWILLNYKNINWYKLL